MPAQLTNIQEMSFFLIRSLDRSKNLIDKIEGTADGGIISYKDGSTLPIKIANNLSAELFCNGYVIIKNIKENVLALIENWQKTSAFEKLVVLFLDEKTGNKWLIRPSVHSKIAEPKTLAQGLITLFEHSMAKA